MCLGASFSGENVGNSERREQTVGFGTERKPLGFRVDGSEVTQTGICFTTTTRTYRLAGVIYVCLSVCLPVCVRACVCACVYVCRPYVRMYVVCTFVLDQRGLHRKSALTVGMYVQGACVVYQCKIMLLGDLPVGGGDGGGGHGVWTWGRPDRQRNISGKHPAPKLETETRSVDNK